MHKKLLRKNKKLTGKKKTYIDYNILSLYVFNTLIVVWKFLEPMIYMDREIDG